MTLATLYYSTHPIDDLPCLLLILQRILILLLILVLVLAAPPLILVLLVHVMEVAGRTRLVILWLLVPREGRGLRGYYGRVIAALLLQRNCHRFEVTIK